MDVWELEEVMAAQPHVERHFRANETVRDIVIGMSDGLTVPFALFVFGYIKGSFTGTKPLRSGFQTALVGGLAAGAAFLLARLIG